MSSLAYRYLTTPQVKKLRDHELAVLKESDTSSISFKGFDIKTYQWGQGTRKILLVHGWEGQAGNFADLILKLRSLDYTIYSFDGPSHGFSSQGSTSLFEFTELVGELIDRYKINQLISHSFGGVATTFALSQRPNVSIDKYVMLTTPNSFLERINDVAAAVGISDSVKLRLIKRLERETGFKVEDLSVADFVRQLNVKQSLIIHDVDDRVIPIAQSRKVHENWDASIMEEISGTGHFRILRTDYVIERVINYLS